MIWDLDITWLLMGIGVVFMISYMLTLMLEATLGGEGFGPFGNATLITSGFFLGITAANYQGIAISQLKYALMIGLAGSFVMTFVLFVLRGIWARM